MEVFCMIVCVISCMLCAYMTFAGKKPNAKSDFTDDEVSKIKQVVNILTWGGEDEDKN